MRALLRGSLGRTLRPLAPEDKLAAAWTVACGKALSERGRVTGFEDGILRVEVTEPAWMGQWLAMRSQLASEISGIAGLPVRAINFEMRGREAVNRGPRSPAPPPRRARGRAR